jgi:hypothetical protein
MMDYIVDDTGVDLAHFFELFNLPSSHLLLRGKVEGSQETLEYYGIWARLE